MSAVYAIVDSNKKSTLNFDKLQQKNENYVRYNKQRTQFIVSFKGQLPGELENNELFSEEGMKNFIKSNPSW